MIVSIADKGFKIDSMSLKKINRSLEKLNKILPHFHPDLISINFFIKRSKDKYHIKRKHRHANSDYTHKKAGLANYEGWIRLLLPRKALYTHFKGLTVAECVHGGIKSLTKEVKRYKDLHFKSQSQYPSQQTIRRESNPYA